MGFRLVRKSVTLNDLERHNGPYFALFHRLLVRCHRFQNLLLIVYDHTNTILAIIQRLFGLIWVKQTLITRFDGHWCIDDRCIDSIDA